MLDNHRLVFKHLGEDGSNLVAHVIPAEGFNPETLIEGGHIPEIVAGAEHAVIHVDDFPTGYERTHYRDAWRWISGADNPVSFDMQAARSIHLGHWREIRSPMLARLDELAARAVSMNDTGERARVESIKTELLDVTSHPDHDLTTCQTAEDLMKVHPPILTRSVEPDGGPPRHNSPPWATPLAAEAARARASI